MHGCLPLIFIRTFGSFIALPLFFLTFISISTQRIVFLSLNTLVFLVIAFFALVRCLPTSQDDLSLAPFLASHVLRTPLVPLLGLVPHPGAFCLSSTLSFLQILFSFSTCTLVSPSILQPCRPSSFFSRLLRLHDSRGSTPFSALDSCTRSSLLSSPFSLCVIHQDAPSFTWAVPPPPFIHLLRLSPRAPYVCSCVRSRRACLLPFFSTLLLFLPPYVRLSVRVSFLLAHWIVLHLILAPYISVDLYITRLSYRHSHSLHLNPSFPSPCSSPPLFSSPLYGSLFTPHVPFYLITLFAFRFFTGACFSFCPLNAFFVFLSLSPLLAGSLTLCLYLVLRLPGYFPPLPPSGIFILVFPFDILSPVHFLRLHLIHSMSVSLTCTTLSHIRPFSPVPCRS
jgi:hypothetical protein